MINPFEDDPFVKAGGKSLTDQQINDSMGRIKRRFTPESSQRTLWQYFGVAASIVLLVGIGIFYFASENSLTDAIAAENYNMGTTPLSASMAAEDTPVTIQLLRDQAIQFYKNGEYDKALKPFNQLNEQQPNNPFYLMYLGDTYLKMGELELAQSHLRAAVGKFKQLGKVDAEDCSRFYLSLALILDNKPEEARLLLEQSVSLKGSISKRAERILKEL